jgi:hypothetical protein
MNREPVTTASSMIYSSFNAVRSPPVEVAKPCEPVYAKYTQPPTKIESNKVDRSAGYSTFQANAKVPPLFKFTPNVDTPSKSKDQTVTKGYAATKICGEAMTRQVVANVDRSVKPTIWTPPTMCPSATPPNSQPPTIDRAQWLNSVHVPPPTHPISLPPTIQRTINLHAHKPVHTAYEAMASTLPKCHEPSIGKACMAMSPVPTGTAVALPDPASHSSSSDDSGVAEADTTDEELYGSLPIDY